MNLKQQQHDFDFVPSPARAKPVVLYTGKPVFHQFVDSAGEPFVCAKVEAIDHPVLGTAVVRTSMLVSQADDDGFETMNTIYKREGA